MSLPNPKKAFTDCYRAFCSSLKSAFPELSPQITSAEMQITLNMHFTKFWTAAQPVSERIFAQDDTLMTNGSFEVLPGVSLASIWTDISVSEQTRSSVWKYISNLYKIAAIVKTELEGAKPKHETTDDPELEKEDEDDAGGLASLLGKDMSNNITKLQNVFTNVTKLAEDLSGEDFTIPEDLQECALFKMIHDLMSDLKAEDLGITGDDAEKLTPEEALKRLVQLQEEDPTKIMGILQKLALKLKTKIEGGSITKDSLLEDAKKFMAFLQSNEKLKSIAEPLKEVFDSMKEQFDKATGRGAKGRPGGRAGETTVRDRLRRKAEERRAAADRK